jgi:ribosomal protein S18 acetylase RimI-like enzyme
VVGTIAIRRPRAADEAAWLGLWQALVATGPEPCSAEAPATVWRRALRPNDAMALWLAVDAADRPQGFVLRVIFPYSWSTRPVCYLLDLYVAPELRGQGLGRRLIEQLAEEGRAAGWLKLMWMTQHDNAEAQRLYDRIATRSSLVRYDLMLGAH